MLTIEDLRAWTKRDMETQRAARVAKLSEMPEVKDVDPVSPKDLPPLERDENGIYKIVCPYCLSKYEVKDILFHARPVPNGMGEYTSSFEPEEDETYITFWENMGTSGEALRPHILDPDPAAGEIKSIEFIHPNGTDHQTLPYNEQSRAMMKKYQVVSVTDKYDRTSSERICPQCHTKLPTDIGFAANYIFTLMGNSYSGKTVYLRRLILSLCSGNFMKGRFFGQVANDEGTSLSDSMVYQARETFQPSVAISNATDMGYIRPVMIQLEDLNTNRRIYVTLFDYPGEGIWKTDEAFFQDLAEKNLKNANGWIMIFDAGMLKAINDMLPQENRVIQDYDSADPSQKATPDEVLNRVIQFYAKGFAFTKPISFVLSKSDLILKCLPKLRGIALDTDPNFLKAPPAHDKVDLEDLYLCDREVRRFLAAMMTNVTSVGDHYTRNNCAWFAFSATGVALENDVIPDGTLAHGVRDTSALEWMLYRCGEIPAVNKNGDPEVTAWAYLLQTNDNQYCQKKADRKEVQDEIALLDRAMDSGKFGGMFGRGTFTDFK